MVDVDVWVCGVLAVVNRPLNSRPGAVTLKAPASEALGDCPVLMRHLETAAADGVELDSDVYEAAGGTVRGVVERVWLDGELVRFEGCVFGENPYSYGVIGGVESGSMVGLPVLQGGQMGALGGVTTLRGWRVSEVRLASVGSRPWPEVELRLA